MTVTEVGRLRSDRGRVVAFARDLAVHGEALALAAADDQLSYAELAEQVDHVVGSLGTERRLVLVAARNTVEAVVGYLGVLAGGHVALLTADSPRQVDDLTDRYDPDVVLRERDGVWRLTERREGTVHELHPDLALLMSTSGTTGSPKLVRLSHENLEANAASIAEYLSIGASDRAITTLPLHYSYGLSVLHSHLARGAGVIVTDLSVVDPCFWDLARCHGATALAGVPYTFDLLDRIGFDGHELPTLRTVTQAGGRLAPDRVADYAARGRRAGWDLVVMYGQTEATARMTYVPPGRTSTAPGAIGVPVPGGSMRLEPVDGLEGDDAGELVYSGPNVMLGYAEAPADLARGREIAELRTGDLARRRSDGMFEVVGRRSRFAKVLGLRVDLDRVESALDAEGIGAACVDRDDLVVVAIGSGAPVGRILRVLERDLGVPDRAVQVVTIDETPRTASGKTDYAALRRLAAERAESQVPLEDPEVGTAAQLLDAFRVALRRPDATDADSFIDLGGDSLSYVEVSIVVERAIGSLPAEWHLTPIGELAAQMPSSTRRRGTWLVSFEVSVLLRAVAILAIVGTHIGIVTVRGGAHVLLAVAGYNVARFQLTSVERRDRVRRLATSMLRIVVPTVVWLGAVMVVAGGPYGWTNLTLTTSFFGPDTVKPVAEWHYWFIEVLVLFLVVLTALAATRWFDHAERRWPFAVPMTLVAAAVVVRFADGFDLHRGPQDLAAPMVAWFFVFGWAAVRARTTAQRLLLTGVVLLAVPGFFDESLRNAVVVVGLLVLLWVRSIRVPRVLGVVASVLAAASLYIYLTHWQVFPHLRETSGLVALVASLAVGIVYWQVVTRSAVLLPRARAGLRERTAARRSSDSETTGADA